MVIIVTQTRLGVKINGSSAEVGTVGYKNIKGSISRIYTLTRAWTKLDLIKLNDLVARLLFSKRFAIKISFRFGSANTATCSDPSLTPTCLVPWQHEASLMISMAFINHFCSLRMKRPTPCAHSLKP